MKNEGDEISLTDTFIEDRGSETKYDIEYFVR